METLTSMQGWIGGALIGALILFGNSAVQWWKTYREQKGKDDVIASDKKIKEANEGQLTHKNDFEFIVGKYKELLATQDNDIKELVKNVQKLTEDHMKCNALMTEYKTRLELTEQVVEELREKVQSFEKTKTENTLRITELEKK